MHELSDTEREQRRAASTTHGLGSAFAKTGDQARLAPSQRAELQATKDELSTPAGVRAALVEHGANAVQVYRWGMAWLADLARREGPEKAFTAPMLARFISVQESARRSLEALARLPSADSAGDTGAITAKYRTADGADGGPTGMSHDNADNR